MASIKSSPLSPFDSMPITVICDMMAPAIKPKPKNAPITAEAGISNKMPVIIYRSSFKPLLQIGHNSWAYIRNCKFKIGCQNIFY